MAKTLYHIYHSPYDFFDEAKKVTVSDFASRSYARSILEDCANSKKGDFNGDWKAVCKKFEEADFDDEASLTDETINEINTVDFNEIKWKFEQRLDEGDAVDTERYLGGAEKCWVGCRRLPKNRQSIRIYINFGGNCFRSAEELAIAGAMGVTFAEIMESMGIATEIWAVHYTSKMDVVGNNYVEMIKLKAQNEYCDFGLVNFMLGNDGVFRNGIFRVNCLHAKAEGHDVAYGLGQSQSIDLKRLGLTEEEQSTAIIVPQVYTKESAIKWLKDVLQDQKKLHELTYTGEEEYRVITDDIER